ncbi:MAG TPA: Do family serine endopeptidase [Opitutaceae bacterium]
MKFSSLPGIAASLALTFALGLAPTAHGETTPPAAPVKMPELKKDFSALSEGKSGLISSYADIVEPVQTEVVSIESSKVVHEAVNPLIKQFFGDVPERDEKEVGLGSGVIVSSDGFILTNNHVVENADELTVEFADGGKFPAKVVGADPKTDIAVIKIEAKGLPAVTFADSDKLRVGDVVFAVGNPLGVGETVTMGIISAKGRSGLGILDDVKGYENYIQTDAAINMGNSGGALVDAKGRLIGINSAIVSPSRGNIGIGFAVPVNMAASVMKSLIETGTVSRGFLGVVAEPITADVAEQVGLPKDAKGVIVTETSQDSPADKAGIKPRDVILSVNGKPIENHDELRLTISQMPPGTKVALEVSRDGKTMTVPVTLSEIADKPNELLTGVEVGKLSDDVRRHLGIDSRIQGLIVTAVDEKSDYAESLPVGTIIMEINRNPVDDLATAKALLKVGHNLVLVQFRDIRRYLVVTKN